MTDQFPAAVACVLESEGVFADARQDPGGATWYGIARAAHPDIPWPPSKDQAIAIYRAEYWEAHRCGEMPWRWALAVFDGAVNQGAGPVVRMAQLALRTVEDGAVGAETLAAMAKAPDGDFFQFLSLRAAAYMALPAFGTFGHGWLARLFRVATLAERHEPA